MSATTETTETRPVKVVYKTQLGCRACRGEMIDVWSLGQQRINAFPATSEELARLPMAPLTLARCHTCGLLQLRDTVERELLFGGSVGRPYWYRSGVNESMVRTLRDTVWQATQLVGGVGPEDVVVDIGANDGTLLGFYAGAADTGTRKGPQRVAIEPALNMRKALWGKTDVLMNTYFPLWEGQWERFKPAKIITSVAVFYDSDDPLGFCQGVADCLAQDGVWVNQLAYLPYMLERRAWDGICHEHLTYYCLSTIMPLLESAGLKLIRVDTLPGVNEGSVRLFITHRDASLSVSQAQLAQIRELCALEREMVLTNSNAPYLQLRADALHSRSEITKTVLGATLESSKIDLLGASTKGNTLLQFCSLGPSVIRRAIERSEEKEGRMTVTGIPIVGEEEGRRNPAKYLIVLPWHFKDAILERERGRWPMGTKMIFPLPYISVVEF
jgi:hypothetical protein